VSESAVDRTQHGGSLIEHEKLHRNDKQKRSHQSPTKKKEEISQQDYTKKGVVN
jgi:hypothetical protein